MRSIVKFQTMFLLRFQVLFKYGKVFFKSLPAGMGKYYITFSEYSKVLLSSGIDCPLSFNSSRYS